MTGGTDLRNSDDVGTTSLQHLLAVARRRWLAIVGMVVLCVAIPVALALMSTPQYEATARVLFGTSTLSDAALEIDRESSDPERAAATNVLLATSDAVAERVRRRLALETSAEQLLDDVSVEAEANANALNLTATATSPEQAAALANGFAEEFIALRADNELRSIQRAEADLRRQLATLPPEALERASLNESLQRLAQLRAVATGDARVVTSADPPAAPASLTPVRAGILGAIIGLALGLALAFVLESLDRRVKSIEELERLYRLRVLSLVPRRHFKRRAAAARITELEPFRILRNTLEVAAAGGDASVLVTSAVPAEGKTTVAIDLAHAIALTRRRVILIELDLRRPTFAEHFDLRGREGALTALVGRRSAVELLQHPLPSLPELAVLPAGPLPPNPAELLESWAVDAMLQSLAEEDATIVIDAPPLVPVADAQALLRQPRVDSALIVSRIGVTTRDEIRRARAILDRHELEPLGLVVTGHQEVQRYGHVPYPPIDRGRRHETEPTLRDALR